MRRRRIVYIFKELVYEVQNFITHAMERAQASQLLQYRADMDGKSASPELLVGQ